MTTVSNLDTTCYHEEIYKNDQHLTPVFENLLVHETKPVLLLIVYSVQNGVNFIIFYITSCNADNKRDKRAGNDIIHILS